VGSVWLIHASAMTMSLSTTASASVTQLGPALRYVGRPADTTSTVATAAYVNQTSRPFW
jgi:hypothetical protein